MKGLTACAYQLIYNLSLIKLSSACAKQTAGVNASDLVKQRASSLILNFEEVLKSFLVWNTYFTFFLPVVDCAFSLEYWRITWWKYSRSNIAETSSLCYVAGF